MVNGLSIDVEDYWSILSRDWLHIDAEPSDAVVRNTEWFLKTLAEHNVKATFFILGEVAKKFPGLITRIAQAGHEVASHGWSHTQIFKLNKEQFRKEIVDSKKLLEDITSCPVFGYRAPAFSVMPSTKWALEVLLQEGFEYDSSIFPVSGKRYGWEGFSKDICRVELPSGRTIVEVPMSTVTILGKSLPAAGGGYIRHFPYAFTRWAIKRIQKVRPAIVYIHPYEIDAEPRAFDMEHLFCKERNRVIKFHKIQQRNRNTTASKLFKLLKEFKFSTIGEVINKTIAD